MQAFPLTGRVVDASTRRGVERAVAKFIETGSRALTESSGVFRFMDLSPGRYTLSVRHIAYAETERGVDV